MLNYVFETNEIMFSCSLPDVTVLSDADFVDLSLAINQSQVFASRYFVYNGKVSIDNISQIVEAHMIEHTTNLGVLTITAKAGGESVSFGCKVVFASRLVEHEDAAAWLSDNFLTSADFVRLSPDGFYSLNWVSLTGEAPNLVYYFTKYQDGRYSVVSNTVSSYTKVADDWQAFHYRFFVADIVKTIAAQALVDVKDVASFSIACGERRITFFIDPALQDVIYFRFHNAFNVVEDFAVLAEVTSKNQVSASMGAISHFNRQYDFEVFKQFECKTDALTVDECRVIEQLLSSRSARIVTDPRGPKTFDTLPQVLFTESSCEFSNSNEQLNSASFTFRFADTYPRIEEINRAGIFNNVYNSIFS